MNLGNVIAGGGNCFVLQQLHSDSSALRLSYGCGPQVTDLGDGHQDTGSRRDVRAQLVTLHRRRGGSVGEKSKLLLSEPILHVSTRAMHIRE